MNCSKIGFLPTFIKSSVFLFTSLWFTVHKINSPVSKGGIFVIFSQMISFELNLLCGKSL